MNFIQLALAFAVGIAALWIVNSIFQSIMNKKIGIAEHNTATATFQAGIVLATTVILSSTIGPGMNAFRFLTQGQFDIMNIAWAIAFNLFFILIGLVMTILVIAAGIISFFTITHINEWEALKNNNIPVAILTASVVIGLAFLLKDFVGHFCEALIPYPEVMNVN